MAATPREFVNIFNQLGELGCLRLFEENREDRGRLDHH
jgi:hypothetical protein